MTDRELLEAAAKAAGITLEYRPLFGGDLEPVRLVADIPGAWTYWNPLAGDGDALRLAVKLQIDIKLYDDHVVAWFDGGYIGTGRINYGSDPMAATRRAIVLAAATQATPGGAKP